MAEIIPFKRNGKPVTKKKGIGWSGFKRFMSSEELKQETVGRWAKSSGGAIQWVFRNAELEIPIDLSVSQESMGLCYPLLINDGVEGNSPNKVVIGMRMTERFPRYIQEQTDMDAEEAMTVAGVYALSISALVSTSNIPQFKRRRRVIADIARTRDLNVWLADVPHPYVNRIAPAAAGFVALNDTSYKGEGLDFSDRYPYPSHIAGLADPVTTRQFRELTQGTIMI